MFQLFFLLHPKHDPLPRAQRIHTRTLGKGMARHASFPMILSPEHSGTGRVSVWQASLGLQSWKMRCPCASVLEIWMHIFQLSGFRHTPRHCGSYMVYRVACKRCAGGQDVAMALQHALLAASKQGQRIDLLLACAGTFHPGLRQEVGPRSKCHKSNRVRIAQGTQCAHQRCVLAGI